MDLAREYAEKTVLLVALAPTTTESSAALSKLRPALVEAADDEAHHVNDIFCAPLESLCGELNLSQQ